jgi:5-methyltetrahydrofolate--homocysteine methyltransferase
MAMDVTAFHKALQDVDPKLTEELVRQHLESGVSPQTVLNDGIIAAMGIVGQDFKTRRAWVPDVLLAARNMHKGIDLLRPLLAKSGASYRGKFLLGTVKGDIHDIGKNIVSMMLQGSGFQVIDLGVDVPTERFVKAVEEHRPHILGMSALLTTTMLRMREVVEAVRKAYGNDGPRIMVGGAPVTSQFARDIGADGYGEDAVAAAEMALQLVGQMKEARR